jgi:hypothetical protein
MSTPGQLQREESKARSDPNSYLLAGGPAELERLSLQVRV